MLVLMGAGASFGSEPVRRITPPLGKDLFARLEERGGVASKLSQELKNIFQMDFEAGMAKLYEQEPLLLQAFHREMAGYLAKFRPRYESYYREIIDLLKDKNVIFASLNYDLLFEESAAFCGRQVNYNNFTARPNIRLLKPHGSINFWPDSSRLMFKDSIIHASVIMDVPIEILSREETIARCDADTSLSPAISMYAKGKRNIVGPAFVKRQKSFFSDACKSVDDIVILGVRVVKDDTHIWDSISSSAATVTYFGGGHDRPEVMAWTAATGKEVNFMEGYFPLLLKWLEAKYRR